jgi:hypothetical protein
MKVHQITRATLSFALAAIGLLAVATPASATEVFKTRVKVTRVVQTESGDYRVKGRIHSPDERCTRRHSVILDRPGDDQNRTRRHSVIIHGPGDDRHLVRKDHTTDRGKFSIRVPQSEEGTFRVWARGRQKGGDMHMPVELKCESDKSRRFTLPPAS